MRHLRWRLALVTDAGAGVGREVALRLGRLGAGVLVADPDATAAAATADLVRACRVSAWSVPAATTDPVDVGLLDQRARDLGGADLLVHRPRADPDPVVQSFLAGLPHRRGRRDEPGVAVLLVRTPDDAPALLAQVPDGARVRTLVTADHADGDTAASAVRLLADVRGGPGSP